METYHLTRSKLIELLQEKQMSINRVANKSGLVVSTIKNIIYGKSKNPGGCNFKKSYVKG